MYYDLKSNTVKTSQHVAYDEAHCGFSDSVSPHSCILGTSFADSPDTFQNFDEEVAELDVSFSPFIKLSTLTLPFQADGTTEHPLAIKFAECKCMRFPYVSNVLWKFPGHSLCATKHLYIGSYITQINDDPIVSFDDLHKILSKHYDADHPPSKLTITFAPERWPKADNQPTPLHFIFC